MEAAEQRRIAGNGDGERFKAQACAPQRPVLARVAGILGNLQELCDGVVKGVARGEVLAASRDDNTVEALGPVARLCWCGGRAFQRGVQGAQGVRWNVKGNGDDTGAPRLGKLDVGCCNVRVPLGGWFPGL